MTLVHFFGPGCYARLHNIQMRHGVVGTMQTHRGTPLPCSPTCGAEGFIRNELETWRDLPIFLPQNQSIDSNFNRTGLIPFALL